MRPQPRCTPWSSVNPIAGGIVQEAELRDVVTVMRERAGELAQRHGRWKLTFDARHRKGLPRLDARL